MFKAFSHLLLGNGVASFISIASIPIISRLYDVQDLGAFYLLLSCINMIAIVLSCRYEQSIVLCRDKRSASAMNRTCVFLVLLVCTIVFVVTQLMQLVGLEDATFETIKVHYPVFFIALLSLGISQIYSSQILRQNGFNTLRNALVLNAGVSAVATIGLGMLESSSHNAVYGYLMGSLCSCFYLVREGGKGINGINFSIRKTCYSLKKYKKFLFVNTPNNFINNFAVLMPIFMLSSFFSSQQVAFYAMAYKLIDFPFKLLMESMRKVYYKYAVDAFAENNLRSIYIATLGKLVVIGGFLSLFLYFSSELIVEIVLGSQWRDSIVFLNLIVLFKFFQFISSPLASSLIILDRQELGLVWTSIFLVVRLLLMYWFAYDPIHMIAAYAISGAVFYLTYNLLCYFMIVKKEDAAQIY
ncbi:MAG: oligosaccharide flippase family protein [Aestuariibacter sp.]